MDQWPQKYEDRIAYNGRYCLLRDFGASKPYKEIYTTPLNLLPQSWYRLNQKKLTSASKICHRETCDLFTPLPE